MPYKLVKGITSDGWFILLEIRVNKARAELTMISKGAHDI